jgi:putative endonuclease
MYYLYILKSQKDDSLYIGQTNNLKRRLFEHNNGESKYTKLHKPFVLKYYEAYLNKDDSIKRETRLKQDGRALSVLKRRISKSLE